ncbi:MAG: HAD family phosphatase, partial [Deltaproteobacteria bacterium]|nr:HAD family phosphatase [Deltaproteobacteria bacterium]
AKSLVEDYRAKGIPTVLMTATCDIIAEPVAGWFGFDTMEATRLALENGRYTGKIIPQYCYGPHKVDYARRICRDRNLDLRAAAYYGDSLADIPLLEAVGFPVAVNPAGELEALAIARGWPIRRWHVKRAE